MKKTKSRKKSVKLHKRSFSGANAVKMLALVLMVVIFADGMIFGLISTGNVRAGMEVLDISATVRQTAKDVGSVLQPMYDVALSVNKFYTLAAGEMAQLLQNNLVNNIASLFSDVNAFYRTASAQMLTAMDMSDELYPNVVYAAH